MQVKLYKKCILNKQYSEVFRNRTLIENYLSHLDNKTFIVDDVYIKLQGEIIVEFEAGEISNNELAFDYNYMRFAYNNNITYAFIDRIEFWNECVKIYYTQDVWSSTVGKWNLRNSLMTSSLWVKQNVPYYKKVPYINNGEIICRKLDKLNNQLNGVFIVGKIQVYDIESGDDTKGILREEYGVLDAMWLVDGNIEFRPLDNITVSRKLDQLMLAQQKKIWYYIGTLSETPVYARVVETYCVPAEFFNDISLYESPPTPNMYAGVNISYKIDGTVHSFYRLKVNTNFLKVAEYTITQNPRIMSVGTTSSQIPLSYNGVSRHLNVKLNITEDTLDIYLCVDNALISITQQFLFTQDYSIVDPSTLAQREIARKQQTWTGIANLVSGFVNTITGLETSIIGRSSMQPKLINDLTPKISPDPYGEIRGDQGMGNGIGQMIRGATDIATANAKKYATSTGVNNDTTAIVNAFYSICIFIMDRIINIEDSNAIDNECGFDVDYIVNNIDPVIGSESFNVVKFDFVRINGVSTEINEIITSILTNGVKIWYTSSLEEIGE